VLGLEKCDDGNTDDGDGCSALCLIEPGFECEQPALGDSMVVPPTVRDFDVGGDFEHGAWFAISAEYANQGLVETTLDANGLKPVLASTTGTYNDTVGRDSGIASAVSFAQWFDETAIGPNTYHAKLVSQLHLYRVVESDPPVYVNRFGNNGDGLTSAQYQRTVSRECGRVGSEDRDADGRAIPCTWCLYDADPSTPQCEPHAEQTPCQEDPSFIACVDDNSRWMGIYLQAAFDGNPLWFPADGLTPASPSTYGTIAGNYDPAYPSDARKHNFSFTTEVRSWFKYDSSKPLKLTFMSQDDLWVFIDKKLVVDLGGIHLPVQGDLTLEDGDAVVAVSNTLPTDAIVTKTSAVSLGLTSGGSYEIAVFQAQRQTNGSSVQISLPAFNRAPSECSRQ